MEDVITISTELSTKGFEAGAKALTRAMNQLSRTAQRMGNSLKRIIPTIIGVGSAYQVLSKAINTYMSQNEELAQRMSSIWTALGNVIGPIVERIVDWVTTAVSYFLSFLKVLGVTNKTASELSKSAKKNNEELRRTIFGFDELNILQKQAENKEPAGLKDVEVPDWVKKLVDFLKNKEWDKAADLLIEKLNELIYRFRDKAYEIGKAIGEYLGGIIHVIARVLDETDWHALGQGIARFVNGLFEDIDGQDIGKILVAKITIALKVLTGFLEDLDYVQLANKVTGIIVGAFDALTKAIEGADFRKIGAGILAFFANIDWDWIARSIGRFLKEAWDAALDFLNGLLTGEQSGEDHPIVKGLKKVEEAAKHLAEVAGPILKQFWEEKLKPMLTWVVEKGLPEFFEQLADAIDDLAKILSGEMSFGEFISQMSTLEKIIAVLAGIRAIGGLVSILNFVNSLRNVGAVRLISDLVRALGGTGAGAGAGAGAAGGGLIGALKALGIAGLAAFDVSMVTYDIVKLTDAAKGFANVQESQLDTIKKTCENYRDAVQKIGKEAADGIYGPLYNIDLTKFNDIEDAVSALSDAVQRSFDGTATSMGEAFALEFNEAVRGATVDVDYDDVFETFDAASEKARNLAASIAKASENMDEWKRVGLAGDDVNFSFMDGVMKALNDSYGVFDSVTEACNEYYSAIAGGNSSVEAATDANLHLQDALKGLIEKYIVQGETLTVGKEGIVGVTAVMHELTGATADYFVELANSGSMTADYVSQMRKQGLITDEVIKLMEQQGVIIQANGEVITKSAGAVKEQAQASKTAADAQKVATEAIAETTSALETVPGKADAAGEGMEGLGTDTETAASTVTRSADEMEKEAGHSVDELAEDVSDAKESIKRDFQELSELQASVQTTMNNLENIISNSMRNIQETIRSAIRSIESIQWRIPAPKIPHINVSYDTVRSGDGSTYSIPQFSVQWRKRGGVFDKATIIGVGEDGEEAVVPLEKNTEWIGKVADKFIEAINNGKYKIGGAGMLSAIQSIGETVSYRAPAIATGTVVPYGISGMTENSNQDSALIDAIREFGSRMDGLISMLNSNDRPIVVNPGPVYINGKELMRVTYNDRRTVDQEHGSSLINSTSRGG